MTKRPVATVEILCRRLTAARGFSLRVGGQDFIAEGREVLQEQVFPHTKLFSQIVKELRQRVRQFQKH